MAAAQPAEGAAALNPDEAPDRLRRAEAVLRTRTNRVAVVLECPSNDMNQQVVLRTAEALGIQNVYVVRTPQQERKILLNADAVETLKVAKHASMGADRWLTIKEFDTIPECIAALRADGRAIWATDLSPVAVPLASAAELAVSAARTGPSSAPVPAAEGGAGGSVGITLGDGLVVPDKVAVVVGRETDGVSEAMLAAADTRVHLPIYGFSESYNLSVATALVLQRIMDAVPECRGDLPPATMQALREQYFGLLGTTGPTKAKSEAWIEASKAGITPTPLSDMRRSVKNKRVVKRIRRREAATADDVGRHDVEGAVSAAKRARGE